MDMKKIKFLPILLIAALLLAALGPGACRELELNPAGPELEYLNRA